MLRAEVSSIPESFKFFCVLVVFSGMLATQYKIIIHATLNVASMFSFSFAVFFLFVYFPIPYRL